MSLSNYERMPKKAKPQTTNVESAWFYANRRGIDVYVQGINGGTPTVVRLSRRQLLEFAKFAESGERAPTGDA